MRRVIRDWSTSTQIATPSFIVTASGWAPPTATEPGRQRDRAGQVPLKRLSATAANVSKVPCRMPWVPM